MNSVSIKNSRAQITLGGVRPQTLLVKRASVTISASGPQGPPGPAGGGGESDHEELANLQGGDTSGHYHLDSAQHGAIAGGSYQQTAQMSLYQSSGAYLTTAMQSNADTRFMGTSERANFFATAGNTFANSTHSHGAPALTNISATSGSNGLSLSVAAQTALVFSNLNGVSFGINGSTVTATVRTDYLTTAMQSNAGAGFMSTSERNNYFATAGNTFANSTHSHGAPTLNLTNLSGTTGSNSAGFTLSLSAAAPGGGAQTGISTVAGGGTTITSGGVTLAGSGNVSITNNGGSIIISGSSQSVQTQGSVQINGLSGNVQFSNSNGVSFGVNGSIITATVRTDYLTTAMQSNAGAGFMSTSERNNYFATAGNTFANATHSHGAPTLNLTNLSGTTGSNSAGFTLSLSAAAPGAGGGAVLQGSGTYTQNTGTVQFSNSNGVTFGLSNNGVMTASVNPGGGAAPSRSFIEIMQGERLTTMANLSATQWSRRPIFCPFWLDGQDLAPKTVRLMVSGAASSNRSLVATFGAALYSQVNTSQLSLLGSDTQAFSITNSADSTVWNGVRFMDFTRFSSVNMSTEGRWVLGIYVSASSHNATFCNMLVYGGDPMPTIAGFMVGGTTSATHNTSHIVPFWGVYSATTGEFPNSVALSQVYGGNSASLMDAYAIIKGI